MFRFDLDGLRIEDQGLQSPQTFLVKNYSLLVQPPGEGMTIGALSSE